MRCNLVRVDLVLRKNPLDLGHYKRSLPFRVIVPTPPATENSVAYHFRRPSGTRSSVLSGKKEKAQPDTFRRIS